tara:strand:- start:175 stop:399 length:225 start_codon:yes stop_codon:yes gene_type:complete
MLEVNSSPDQGINFVLVNGWRLNALVDEETGDMTVRISNENGEILSSDSSYRFERKQEEYTEVYKVAKNEKENN